jgi:hypothetical protein
MIERALPISGIPAARVPAGNRCAALDWPTFRGEVHRRSRYARLPQKS